MAQFTLMRWLIAAALLLPCAAGAAGMGRLTVLSSLGQPFSAEIELLAVQKEDLASLSVRLASPEAYQQANLQYGPALIGLRMSIEQRTSGQPFIRVTSSRPVNEPFLDLLIELNWASGRLVREFTALVDPPGMAPPAPVAAAPVTPQPARPIPAPTPAAPAARTAVPSGSYGPVQRGETLSRIASGLKPEGVSLEQMLVGLYRSNPDAFIKKNMNLIRSGKILRVPDRNEIAAISQGEALKEYRAQVADWKSYRAQVSEAPAAARESATAASGRVSTRIEDKTPAEARDVVRLSKGEAPQPGAAAAGTQASGAERIKALEEEVTSREKALKEANERIAQLEKTVKDMQRLAEIKSATMAAAQDQAKAAAKPEPAKSESKPPVSPQTEAPPKAEGAPAPKGEEKPADKAVVAKAPEQPAPTPPAEKPKPKPDMKAQPVPVAPATSPLDDIPQSAYLGGGAAILLGGLGYWLMRRRREQESVAAVPPVQAVSAAVKKDDPLTTVAQESAPAAPVAVAELDPLDEASVYVTHGRDTQAESILKEAIAKNPGREALHVKLLEIYALRKDKAGFTQHAEGFHKLNGGAGDNWIKVAAMGFGLDPSNPLFGGGREPTVATVATPGVSTTELDFNLDVPAEEGTTAVAASSAPDIELEIPATPGPGTAPGATQASAGAASDGSVDFEVGLPSLDVPPVTRTAAPAAADSAGGLDFKLDLSALDLSLDEKKSGTAAPAMERDAHWHDVQAKFDLVKAYQEMGDKAGAAEILREVMREGDAGQQAQAKALLEKFG